MKTRSSLLPARAVALMGLLLSACAADVARQPGTFTPLAATETVESRTVQREVSVTLNSGYTRLVQRGMRCELVGKMPQGKVYRVANTVFTVEGAHIHEAYLVVNKGKLVGFYLPVERAFSTFVSSDTQLWEE